MTQLLEKVFTKAGKLSEVDQDVFAKWMLKELASENHWDKDFARSEDVLEILAKEAMKEHKNKKTKILDLNSL